MRPKRKILWIAGTLAVLVLGYYNFILDWAGKPMCHNLLTGALMGSMQRPGVNIVSDPQPFPNVKGVSRDSLATIHDSVSDNMDWVNDYNYVPGLRSDDPGEMVLMYLNRPTRWTWHGVPPTIFKDKAWIIIPVDFAQGMRPRSGQGEESERVSSEEFQGRLRRTLDFIRTNERPNWQAVVAEHTKFLDSNEHIER